MKKAVLILSFVLESSVIFAQARDTEQYRPQIHFSPAKNWTNDPNGMVNDQGTYHLFYQYHPYSTVWGPMHWGHATSRDLVHWKRLPIALYPDTLGMIFSGSAVVDKLNTSGFGKNGHAPLVAIFTQHNAAREKQGRNDFQNQSIAYSLDNGDTWTKYSGNPVLRNPGISDFRDPKVFWDEQAKKWIMSLATKDCVTFYSSSDLKNWRKETEFGKTLGAHGGVWECPDLFPLGNHNKQLWVLIVNINPGGPNGGAATQYFLGDFDGHEFKPIDEKLRWLDYGPDEYAGITWSNTGNRRIFIGWMSNWQYANKVPTEAWRNAMTIPRELSLTFVGEQPFVVSRPVQELQGLALATIRKRQIHIGDSSNLESIVGPVKYPFTIKMTVDEAKSFSIVLENRLQEKVIAGFDQGKNNYFIDRLYSGKTGFDKNFPAVHSAPRLANDKQLIITLVVDVSSVELFADDGLTVMTEIFFPTVPFNRVQLLGTSITLQNLEYMPLKSIWQ